MAGRSGFASPGRRSVRSLGELSMFWLLVQIQIVTGNQGSIVGSCPCDSRLNEAPNPKLRQVLIANLQKYESCNNYIRFHLPKRTLCSSSKNAWVQELRTCFDNKECGSGNQGIKDDGGSRSIGIQDPKSTEPSHSPFTTTNPVSQTNQTSRIQPRGTENSYLNDTTSASWKNSSITNLKWEAEKGQVAQQGTSATIPVLCLLGIVFVLFGALAYVLCRKRVPKQHPKGFELIIPCETNPPDSWI